MRRLSTLTLLLFAGQLLLCGLSGFGEGSSRAAWAAAAPSCHGAPSGGDAAPEREGDERCLRHCQLYRQSGITAAPELPPPPALLLALAPAVPAWTSFSPGASRRDDGPPAVRDLPILNASLLL